jgi:phage terminase large subunit
MSQVTCYMPGPAQEVLSSNKRFKVLYGGRGSGKSTAVANYIVIKALSNKRILCAREFQQSLKDSVHRLLVDCIYNLKLEKYFTIQQDSIKSVYGGYIVFYGLKNNPHSIKSLEKISVVWIEEAETISENSLEILTPTIREDDSEIIFTFNPETASSPVYNTFVNNSRPDTITAKLNYDNNDYFPQALRGEMEWCKQVDHEKYLWIWEGQLKKYAEDVIFKNKCEFDQEFETPPGTRFYFGLDFGFSNDPLSCHRYWIGNNNLYIDYEVYGRGIELDEIPRVLLGIPDIKRWEIGADASRPDTISYLHNKGFRIIGAEKGEGSVDDGITFLRGFNKIIVHKRCPGAKEDFCNYRWKRDKITQDILPIPIDKSNHACDDARYALWRYMKQKVSSFEVLKRLG